MLPRGQKWGKEVRERMGLEFIFQGVDVGNRFFQHKFTKSQHKNTYEECFTCALVLTFSELSVVFIPPISL